MAAFRTLWAALVAWLLVLLPTPGNVALDGLTRVAAALAANVSFSLPTCRSAPAGRAW